MVHFLSICLLNVCGRTQSKSARKEKDCAGEGDKNKNSIMTRERGCGLAVSETRAESEARADNVARNRQGSVPL